MLRETTMALVAIGGDLTALSPEVYSIAVQGRLIWVVKDGTLSSHLRARTLYFPRHRVYKEQKKCHRCNGYEEHYQQTFYVKHLKSIDFVNEFYLLFVRNL